MITEDDFNQWRDNAVTQAVFEAFDKLSERAKQEWLHASWDAGNIDELLLADLRARAYMRDDFRDMTFEVLEEWLGDDSD